MTLGEIRSEIARVVDNGVSANDPRVIQRVNQAQRRLHAIRSWLGLFAKYKVDVVANIFTLPVELENVHSVTRYTGTALPAGNVLLSQDANAFVHLDGDIVPLVFRPVSAAGTVSYQIDPSLGQNLTSVVVAGKKIFVPATSDSSTLLIDDLEALKLMVMALWREENNQLELASGLQAKAVEHLALKTDMAIEVARRLAYQTRLSSASPGTMAFVRSRLALDLNFGLKTDETQMFDLVNKAQDMLIDIKRTLLASGRYGVKDGLSLPSYSYIVSDSAQLPVPDYTTVKLAVLALMANSVNDKNPQLNPELAAKYEAEATKSLEQDLMVELERKRHDEYSTALTSSQPNTFGRIKARLALDLPNGLRLSNNELTRTINRAEEILVARGKWAGAVEELKVTIPKEGLFYLPGNVESILSATLNDVPVPVFDQHYDYNPGGPGFQTEEFNSGTPSIIARGEKIVSNQRLRVYFVRGNWTETACARLLVKRRHVDYQADQDPVLIRNYSAVYSMVLSLLLQEQNPETAKYHEEQALSILRSELEQFQASNLTAIKVQPSGFSMGDIGAMV